MLFLLFYIILHYLPYSQNFFSFYYLQIYLIYLHLLTFSYANKYHNRTVHICYKNTVCNKLCYKLCSYSVTYSIDLMESTMLVLKSSLLDINEVTVVITIVPENITTICITGRVQFKYHTVLDII